LTVGDWLAHWLVSRTSPAASTLRSYTAHVRLYLAPTLGPVLLGELSAAHVQAMFTAIIRHHQAFGTPISAATLNRIRATPGYQASGYVFTNHRSGPMAPDRLTPSSANSPSRQGCRP
jgi:hypothetical protein